MKFNHNNCYIIINDGVGTVYRDGKLMFKGDGYIAIKYMLNFTNNADEVRQRFQSQLSTREKTRWQQQDEKAKLEAKMKSEATKAQESIVQKSKKKPSKITLKNHFKMTK